MNQWAKFMISVIGISLVTFSTYYTNNTGAWVGGLVAAAGAVGSYCMGLFQKNPFTGA